MLCTILDIFLVFYIIVFNSGSSTHNGVLQEPLQTLSTYMNLDELYAHKIYKTRHLPIINIPRNYFQVSSAHPRTQLPYWSNMKLSSEGNITFAEYRFLVTSEVSIFQLYITREISKIWILKVSTIGQFRAIDYGMEKCSLRLKTPQKNSTTVNIDIKGGNATLDVWQLSTGKHLTGKVSWDSKPPRNRLVSTTHLSYGMDITLFDFRCTPGTFHTYEVACHDAPCHVDGTWWKGGRERYLFH